MTGKTSWITLLNDIKNYFNKSVLQQNKIQCYAFIVGTGKLPDM